MWVYSLPTQMHMPILNVLKSGHFAMREKQAFSLSIKEK